MADPQSRVDSGAVDPATVQQSLDDMPPPAEPLDVVMLDGFVCAVLLRDQPLAIEQWLPFVLDIEGRASAAAASQSATLKHAVSQRADALRRAIAGRQWFDPWVYELETGSAPGEAVMPWAAGFAMAAERFPLSMPTPAPAADEASALIYQYLDAADWPAVQALQVQIELLEPPRTLADAVEDLVRGVLLLADLAGPRAIVATKPGSARSPAGKRRSVRR